jgi:hypothetical protein
MSDWEHRQLCPDGSCVGLIGPDGTCKTCGRAAPNWGDERMRGMVAADDDSELEDDADDDEYEDDDEYDDDEYEDDGEDGDDAEGAEGAEGDEDGVVRARSGDWQERKLCPDGGCVGVIGDAGTCKVCGRSAA